MQRLGWLSMRKKPKKSFTSRLEEKACDIAATPVERYDSFVGALLRSDIALLLDQVEKLKSNTKEINRSLLEAECEIGTELIQMEQRTPRYSPYRFPEREKLQRRLGEIHKERRQLRLTLDDKLDSFHDRLLSLIKKHRQLSD